MSEDWLTAEEAFLRFGPLQTDGVVKRHFDFKDVNGIWMPEFGDPLGMGIPFGELLGYRLHRAAS